jgi:hypothetical protein
MTKRTFTASDIREFVEIFRNSPDVTPEKFSGMEFIANLCRQMETMSDEDIVHEVKRLYAKS